MNVGELVISDIDVIVLIIGGIQVVKQFIEADGKEMSVKLTMIVALIVGSLFLIPSLLVLNGMFGPQAEAIFTVILQYFTYLLGIVGGYGVVNEKLKMLVNHK